MVIGSPGFRGIRTLGRGGMGMETRMGMESQGTRTGSFSKGGM